MSKGGKRAKSASKRRPSPQQKNPPPEKRSPRQKQELSWVEKMIVTLVKASPFLFLGSCVIELVVSFAGNITLVITAVGPLLIAVIAAVSEDLFKADKDDEKPGEDDGLFDRIAMGGRNIGYRIWTNTRLTVLFAAVAVLLGSTALAAVHTGGHALNAAKEVVNRLTAYEEPAADAGDTPHVSPDPSSIVEEPAPEMPEEQTLEAVPGQYVRLLEPGRILELSDAERAELYYFAGEYAVGREKSELEICSAVKKRIEALVNEKREDGFNQTEEGDENRTAAKEASDDEKEMETSDDLDKVIGIRKTVYEAVPGAEIAKLIAENYNGYGLAYHSIHGSKKTMEIYWNESLTWYHNCLTFQGSPGEISGILRRIGMRYQDLAMIQEFGSDEQIRATMLSKAYKSLAEYYMTTG